jgi:hypothetical protein
MTALQDYTEALQRAVNGYCAACGQGVPSKKSAVGSSATRFFGIVIVLMVLYVVAVGLMRRRN